MNAMTTKNALRRSWGSWPKSNRREAVADNKVCIVFNADFGEALYQLDLSIPIWIVQSQQNNPVVADLWKAKAANITSFQPQEFGQLVDTVDQHHPGWSELEVRGVRGGDAAGALAEFGGGHFIPIPDGFVFHRKI